MGPPHAGTFCECTRITDVSFLQPVPTGCVLQFHAKVCMGGGGRREGGTAAT